MTRTYVGGISDATSRKGWRSQTATTVSTMGAPIQNPPKCPEDVPSEPGANDGREKCAAPDVIGGSLNVLSVTTPSSFEAQAESTETIIKASIPHQAEHLFTEPNLLITAGDATSAIPRIDAKEMRHEKILRGKRSSPLVQHGRQLGRA